MQQPQENPFASPTSHGPPPVQYEKKPFVVPAGQGLRLANLLIDRIAQVGISFGIGFTLGTFGGEPMIEFLESIYGILIEVIIAIAYYFVLEVSTGRTLGKIVTGTKVVNEDGGPASVGQILGRSFSRLIPFEAFSFLGTPCRGWHDSIPNTYVVKA